MVSQSASTHVARAQPAAPPPAGPHSQPGHSQPSNKTKKHGFASDLRKFFRAHFLAEPRPHSGPSCAGPHGHTSSSKNEDPALVQLKNYGQWGPTVGQGAGGRVRLMRRHKDKEIVAVKQFRVCREGESEVVYRRKAVAELCMGAALRHRNVIQMLDVFISSGPKGSVGRQYWGVMEYAPFDLFTVVMSGQMCRKELYCLFRQIVDGVDYLHTRHLAHRDLKLDNCVLTRNNVVKLVDFGTATAYNLTPQGHESVSVTGVVGSDPYLAPEVLSRPSYDPRLVDVWSLGIIFLCMVLRRFPWKVADARVDPSFRLYVQSHPELVCAPSSTPPEPTRTRSKALSAVVEHSTDELNHSNRSSPPTSHSAFPSPLGHAPSARSASPDSSHPPTAGSMTATTPGTPPSILFDDMDELRTTSRSTPGPDPAAQSASCLACADPGTESETEADQSTVCDCSLPSTPTEPPEPTESAEPSEATKPPEPTESTQAGEPTVREEAPSKASETTYQKGSSDSIFRLIPRESRGALQRMLAVHPGRRWTLNQLLRGENAAERYEPLSLPTTLVQAQKLLQTPRPTAPLPPHEAGEAEDPWLGSITTCASLLDDPQARADHPHVQPAEEASFKKGFFHR